MKDNSFEEKVVEILKEGFKYVAKEIGFEPVSYEWRPYSKAISTAKTALLALFREEAEGLKKDVPATDWGGEDDETVATHSWNEAIDDVLKIME